MTKPLVLKTRSLLADCVTTLRSRLRGPLSVADLRYLFGVDARRRERVRPALLEEFERSRTPLREASGRAVDLIVIGAGVLGTSLTHAAVQRGIKVLNVSAAARSTSLRYGETFQLNTWNRRPTETSTKNVWSEQHPGFLVAPWRITRRLFLPADFLADLAFITLLRSGAVLVRGEVEHIRDGASAVSVVVRQNETVAQLSAGAAIYCPGLTVPSFGQTEVRRAATKTGAGLLDFHEFCEATLDRPRSLPRGHWAVIGAGPSGLSALELLLRRRRVTGEKISWFRGSRVEAGRVGTLPSQGPLAEMFSKRYATLSLMINRATSSGLLEIRNENATLVDELTMTVETGERRVEGLCAIVWCGGLKPDLSPLETAPLEAVRAADGQTIVAARPKKTLRIYATGTWLDELGFGQWPTGPHAEWFAKGQLLIDQLLPGLR